MPRIGSDDALASLEALERCLTGEANEGASLAARLALLSRAAALFQERLRASESRLHQVTGRLEEILEVVTSLTALEYDRKVPLSDDDDWIVNALAIGLNIMGDELAQATRELTTARDGALAASRAKSTFLANMSHELRTPLNAIIGYSELIREELDAGECYTISADLGHVENSAHHLLDLIQDTLDLSKIEAGKMELTVESFDLGALLRAIASTVEPLMRDRSNRLSVTIADDLGTCNSDRTKCRQIFYNLLSNAAKFTENGSIKLRAHADEGGQDLLIEVEDSGIGIPVAKLPVIFGAFTQADNSTSRDYGGTGLGLTISRHFAEMLGGALTVTSIVGEGSIFTVRLPRQAPIGEVPSPHMSLPGNVVIIADRDACLHDLLRRRLAALGFAVLSAATYHDLLALCTHLRPVLIVLDASTPVEDSGAALGNLCSEIGPVQLFVSGDTPARDRAALRELEIPAVHSRPVDIDRVITLALRFRKSEHLGSLVLLSAGDSEVLSGGLKAAGWGVFGPVDFDPDTAPDALVVDLRGGRTVLDQLCELPWPDAPLLLVVDADDRPEVARPHVIIDLRTATLDNACLALTELVHRSDRRGP